MSSVCIKPIEGESPSNTIALNPSRFASLSALQHWCRLFTALTYVLLRFYIRVAIDATFGLRIVQVSHASTAATL